MAVQIISILLSALLTENFVMVKFYGICPFLGVSKKVDTALGMGMAVTFVMALASAITWIANKFLLIPFGLEYLQTILFILVIAGLVQFVEMFVKKSMPSLYNALGIYLPLITTNCAVLGVTLLNVQNYPSSFLFALLYGIFAALGFTLAIVLMAGIRETLDETAIPKAFRGFPIALITAGLMSIAFMGFSGFSI
ncbi:MAG: electron transport complex subunit RsxA [Oscillospiraceae bacterium]|nr:electron transport complex subunit RsxA [Oscillospiraceae bacterium]